MEIRPLGIAHSVTIVLGL